MAENADSTSRAIARYIGSKVGIRTEFVVDMPWEQREYLFDIGEIQVCWICGLPYVWKVDAGQPAIELCAVPVMLRERYGNAPVYFSDVAVHRDSHFETFDDLRGTSWSYNERRSHSGYNVVRHLLAQIGETGGYFGRVIESGSHQASLRMILDRKIDASAIDSTVLEAEFRRDSAIESKIRIVKTLGPSPMPPWVVHKNVSDELRSAISKTLLEMHADPNGRCILDGWGISHFTTAEHSDYRPIQDMALNAEGVLLSAPCR
jgi:phosphonate transport system substrate-binding protein